MVLDPTLTLAYLVLATVLAVSPGPDVLFVVANGIRHQHKGAIAAAFGIAAGSFFHAIAAAVGISAVIKTFPVAFDLLKYSGAAYLFYLGMQALHSWVNQTAGHLDVNAQGIGASVWKVFYRGFITNLLNPKVIIFYLALLPQFVNVELGHVGLQAFFLGCIHNLIGLIFLIFIGLVAGQATDWLKQTHLGRHLEGIAGLFFVGLALRLILSDRPGNAA